MILAELSHSDHYLRSQIFNLRQELFRHLEQTLLQGAARLIPFTALRLLMFCLVDFLVN
jgi:hypothetical protein